MCKSLQEKTFLPNLLFDNLNPAITPFYSHLEVSTQTSAWPEPLDGGLRRASVNSFGFGGANSHAILEEYRPPYTNGQRTNGFSPSKACFVPFVFSASSETTLRRILSGYSSHLSMTFDIDPQNLAFTLSSKRSAFAHRTYFAAESLDDLQVQLSRQSEDQTLSFPKVGPKKGGTIGIFTGQVSLYLHFKLYPSNIRIGSAMGRHGQTTCFEVHIRHGVSQALRKKTVPTRGR